MAHDNDAVARDTDIELERRDADGRGRGKPGERVLWHQTARATVALEVERPVGSRHRHGSDHNYAGGKPSGTSQGTDCAARRQHSAAVAAAPTAAGSPLTTSPDSATAP